MEIQESGSIDSADESQEECTGSHGSRRPYSLIRYPFGKYEILVKVGPGNLFMGIHEVRINKSFLSYKQKLIPQGYHDVDEFYRE